MRRRPPPVLLALAAAAAASCGGERAPAPRPAPPVGPERVLSRPPYLGVACPQPNAFGCDRVGLAVWLRRPAVRVRATVAGRRLALDDRQTGPQGRRRVFIGYLRPAGLLDGPLRITADDGPGRWVGRTPVTAPVRLWIRDPAGRTVTTQLRVGLHAGWG